MLANRIAYLGCVFLPLFMLMTIMKVCLLKCPKIMLGTLVSISLIVFLIVASQGYLDLYYRDVQLVFVNGMAKLEKVYGPLHSLYYIYLFTYFGIIISTIVTATVRKTVASYKHAGLLAIVVFLNIAIWLVEQFINWNFEQGNLTETNINVTTIDELAVICPEVTRLSNREREVLQKILEDKKRKEIADELYITENTVKKHISNIFTKLEIANRNELFAKIEQNQT